MIFLIFLYYMGNMKYPKENKK